jgi:hypothetical protein
MHSVPAFHIDCTCYRLSSFHPFLGIFLYVSPFLVTMETQSFEYGLTTKLLLHFRPFLVPTFVCCLLMPILIHDYLEVTQTHTWPFVLPFLLHCQMT